MEEMAYKDAEDTDISLWLCLISYSPRIFLARQHYNNYNKLGCFHYFVTWNSVTIACLFFVMVHECQNFFRWVIIIYIPWKWNKRQGRIYLYLLLVFSVVEKHSLSGTVNYAIWNMNPNCILLIWALAKASHTAITIEHIHSFNDHAKISLWILINFSRSTSRRRKQEKKKLI